ncbi:MAG: bifunctional adenosylcobinamide kinase/adenosylcobinamide-phosphate guanylyltransferase [Selenomonadaceae bacterium]|nr:bifunctional adenosylcobinamide kinase/adenosylcobinamide-phosphate guanylyltransferase [Selenomonadaceae bacterium]MBR6710599.1 bifunctional adenosylcobinamide kinase/adenosylcobinamide-phosphate guanylyltransferase [Selenomonadaceae bacterium]
MGKIVLVTGGARSGKSRFAESYAAKHGKHVAYIATAQVYDEEMAYRVKLHQRRRPKEWQTFEAPFHAERTLEEAGREHDMILFDCLTLYISNLICAMPTLEDFDRNYQVVREQVELLIAQARKNQGTSVFVTNEVGAGIVPENHLSREYRDLAGISNQLMARAAEEVYLVACGLPVNIKKLAEVV